MANIYTNDAHEFWRDRAWPDDDQIRGYTFLARAMLDIGHALFRDKWTGAEPFLSLAPRPLPAISMRPVIPPPLVPTAALAQDAKEAPDDGPWWRKDGIGLTPSPSPKTIERDIEAENALAEARARWDEVMAATAYFFNASHLDCAWRGLFGGGFRPVPDTDWNTERHISWRRFLLCRMNHQQAFSIAADGPVFIYVTTASLKALIDKLCAVHPEATEAQEAEPAPVEVPESEGATEGNAPRYVEFRAALRARVVADPYRLAPENRLMNKQGVRQWGKAEFGLSQDTVDVERSEVWQALASEGVEHVWNKGGRPKAKPAG